jgi:hypothetical protein
VFRNSRISRRAGLVALATCLLVAVAGGVAYASIPDGSGVIHGCYKTPVPTHGSALSVIDTDAGGSCGGGMTAVTWNQTGPQGPAGATGPAGPPGPSPAATTTTRVAHYDAGQQNTFFETVSCPAGSHAVNGGVLQSQPEAGWTPGTPGQAYSFERQESADPSTGVGLTLPRPVDADSGWRIAVFVEFPVSASTGDPVGIDVTLFVNCI